MNTQHETTGIMLKTHARGVRRVTLAVTCVAAITSLAACGPDNAGKAAGNASGPASSSAPGASTGSQAKPNGIEKQSGKEIYLKATQANADAKSFREQATSSKQKTDLKLSATECVGTVNKLQQGSFEIIRKDNDIWVKADAQFSAGAKAHGGAIPSDKWLHGTPSNLLMKALGTYCHQEQFTKPSKGPGDLTLGKSTTVNGVSVVPASMKVGDKGVTYYVANTGTPNLIKREVTGRDDLPTISYSDFGKPVGASAPTGEIVEAPSH
ncbi:hypothetical protein ACO0M4_04365 [Streptomyces sp. RGM 3693]|uniref:hypothetical protein n=1 Tax=Streptomyces sp. RGM 3693 TaxID=3413284 RepID=UPI003D2CE505